MSERAPVRRPVGGEAATEDREGRRGCLLIGAILGVGIGTLVALFVVPPLLNHYFGTGDIELGTTYREDGNALTVREAERVPGDDGELYPGTFEVVLDVTAGSPWAPTPSTFELELTDGTRLQALDPEPARPETSFVFELAEPRELVLRFPGVERRDVEPDVLHVSDPEVRLHLQPGEPE